MFKKIQYFIQEKLKRNEDSYSFITTDQKPEVSKNSSILDIGYHSYCSNCGNKYQDLQWPRKCYNENCKNITYKPFAVVVVGVIPVRIKNQCGILLAKRAENPCAGGMNLIGGHLEFGETWNYTLARETFEEINLKTDPTEWSLSAIRTATNGNIIIFANTKIKEFDNLDFFIPNNEVSEIKLGTEFMDLCFESHTEIFNFYLKALFKNRSDK